MEGPCVQDDFNNVIKELMRAPYHRRRSAVYAALNSYGVLIEECVLDGSADMCYNLANTLRPQVETVGERGPDLANLGCEIADVFDRVCFRASRSTLCARGRFYGAGIQVVTAWDGPEPTKRGDAPRSMLGIMLYKLGDLDENFEAERNPIEDADAHRAIMYYLVTREGSVRGLGKSLTMLFLADVDAAGMEAVLNLGVDTPAAFYEQFGFRHVNGKYTKKRMLRPGVPLPRKRAVAPAKAPGTPVTTPAPAGSRSTWTLRNQRSLLRCAASGRRVTRLHRRTRRFRRDPYLLRRRDPHSPRRLRSSPPPLVASPPTALTYLPDVDAAGCDDYVDVNSPAESNRPKLKKRPRKQGAAPANAPGPLAPTPNSAGPQVPWSLRNQRWLLRCDAEADVGPTEGAAPAPGPRPPKRGRGRPVSSGTGAEEPDIEDCPRDPHVLRPRKASGHRRTPSGRRPKRPRTSSA